MEAYKLYKKAGVAVAIKIKKKYQINLSPKSSVKWNILMEILIFLEIT